VRTAGVRGDTAATVAPATTPVVAEPAPVAQPEKSKDEKVKDAGRRGDTGKKRRGARSGKGGGIEAKAKGVKDKAKGVKERGPGIDPQPSRGRDGERGHRRTATVRRPRGPKRKVPIQTPVPQQPPHEPQHRTDGRDDRERGRGQGNGDSGDAKKASAAATELAGAVVDGTLPQP